MDKKIKALDLFAGAGGFSYGMECSGIEVVAAIEFDEKIAITYKENHPNTYLINEDIRKVAVKKENLKEISEAEVVLSELIDVMDIDIVFGGPPCQGFSMAGKRIRQEKSFFEDERNLLFLEFLRIVDQLKPKAFIIENVPGILNYNNGSVKDEIYQKFGELGYNVSSKILSAEKFGVPQKRKRAIFIGNNVGLDSKKLFPVETHNELNQVTVWDAIGDLSSLKSGEGEEITEYDSLPNNEYQEIMRNTSEGVYYNHIAPTHKEKTIEILKMIKPGQTMRDLPINMQTKSIHSGAYGRMKKDEPSYTLTTRINTPSVGKITHPIDNRTITPREAARIQSFPDSYRFIGDITTVGMQVGNSVPPLLGKAIGEAIIKKLSL